jgi:hypothetical protein
MIAPFRETPRADSLLRSKAGQRLLPESAAKMLFSILNQMTECRIPRYAKIIDKPMNNAVTSDAIRRFCLNVCHFSTAVQKLIFTIKSTIFNNSIEAQGPSLGRYAVRQYPQSDWGVISLPFPQIDIEQIILS